jgi:hypothetical protein
MTTGRRMNGASGKEGNDCALACVAQTLGVPADFAPVRAVASALPALQALIGLVSETGEVAMRSRRRGAE